MQERTIRQVGRILAFSVLLAGARVMAGALDFPDGQVPAELFHSITGYTAYRSLPDDFPLVPLPAGLGLHLVGSFVNGPLEGLLLRNPGDGFSVRDMLRDAYVAAGWKDISRIDSQAYLCKDSQGALSISASGREPGNYLNVRYVSSQISFTGGMSCSLSAAYNAAGYPNGLSDYLLQFVPALEVGTSGAPRFRPVVGVYSSLVNDYYATDTDGIHFSTERQYAFVDSDSTLTELMAGFANQLTGQDWVAASSDAGSLSGSSTWFRIVSGPQIDGVDTSAYQSINLTCILILVAQGEGRYQAILRVFSSPDELLAP